MGTHGNTLGRPLNTLLGPSKRNWGISGNTLRALPETHSTLRGSLKQVAETCCGYPPSAIPAPSKLRISSQTRCGYFPPGQRWGCGVKLLPLVRFPLREHAASCAFRFAVAFALNWFRLSFGFRLLIHPLPKTHSFELRVSPAPINQARYGLWVEISSWLWICSQISSFSLHFSARL